MFLVNKCWSTNVFSNWEEWYLEIRKVEEAQIGCWVGWVKQKKNNEVLADLLADSWNVRSRVQKSSQNRGYRSEANS